MANVLIDASNLRVGGGVQVAASFIDELILLVEEEHISEKFPWLSEATIAISPEVLENLTGDTSMLHIAVTDHSKVATFLRLGGRRFDVRFSVFGPMYGSRRAILEIMGFADGLSLWPEFFRADGARSQLKFAIRRAVAKRVFASADVLIVEAAHVGRDLSARWKIPAHRIVTIPNIVNSVLRGSPAGTRQRLPEFDGVRFAFPTRAYPHKNLAILGAAAVRYSELFGEAIQFVLTLNPHEWSKLDERTRSHSLNVGVLGVGDLSWLYTNSDAVVFPSLVESFSVTPLEAAVARRPLFASDRKFVREILGDAASYFDPEDARSVALSLRAYVEQPELIASRVEQAARLAANWPSARDRAYSYLEVVDQTIKSHGGPVAPRSGS